MMSLQLPSSDIIIKSFQPISPVLTAIFYSLSALHTIKLVNRKIWQIDLGINV